MKNKFCIFLVVEITESAATLYAHDTDGKPVCILVKYKVNIFSHWIIQNTILR